MFVVRSLGRSRSRGSFEIDGAGVVSHLEVVGERSVALFSAIASSARAAARAPPAATMVEKGKSRKDEVVTREYTIHLHKRLHGW